MLAGVRRLAARLLAFFRARQTALLIAAVVILVWGGFYMAAFEFFYRLEFNLYDQLRWRQR